MKQQVNHRPFFASRYEKVHKSLAEHMGTKNPHKIPKLKHIVLHARYGAFLGDSGRKRFVKNTLAVIACATPHDIKARKSVAQFKIRAGALCGCKVTLRGDAMYEFLARLWIALPRMRNFNGLHIRALDGSGNCNFGVVDHAAFLEAENMVEQRFGFDIAIATTATSNEKCKMLLTEMGIPFAKE